jgi:hypothetical protein
MRDFQIKNFFFHQDEISEKTDLRLKSCRRQFDNIKRIYKVIEEMPGHYVKNIESQVKIN